MGAVIAGIAEVQAATPDAPFLAFWHTIRTHAPWNVDRDGRQIFPSRVPIVPGAHMVGSEADQTYTTDELKSLRAPPLCERRRRLRPAARRARRRAEGVRLVRRHDDHRHRRPWRHDDRAGRPPRGGHPRAAVVRGGPRAAHGEVGRARPTPEVVTEPRSTGQIAATVVAATGAQPPASLELSPDLSADLPSGPVFTTVAGGVLTPWEYDGITEVDPWRPDDLTPPDPRYPFAIGIDASLLGAPVPAGWVEVPDVRRRGPPRRVRPAARHRRPGRRRVRQRRHGRPGGGGRDRGRLGPVGGPGRVDDGPTRGWAIVPEGRPGGLPFFCPPRRPPEPAPRLARPARRAGRAAGRCSRSPRLLSRSRATAPSGRLDRSGAMTMSGRPESGRRTVSSSHRRHEQDQLRATCACDSVSPAEERRGDARSRRP